MIRKLSRSTTQVALAAACCVALVAFAASASGEGTDSEQTLEQRMDALEQRFADERRAYDETLAAQRDEIDSLKTQLDDQPEEKQGFSLPGVSAASFLDSVYVHGFGGWAYGDTNGNPFLTGSDSGNWNNAQGGFTLGGRPHESLLIQGKLFADQGGEDREEGSVELEQIFAEWKYSDPLGMRVGKLPQPIGIYSEIYDIGTLRPFLTLPQGAYGATGINAKTLEGGDFTGSVEVGGWSAEYDVYGAELDLDVQTSFLLFDCEDIGGEELCEEIEEEEEHEVDDVVGGRLVVRTPIDGLSVGVAGYIDAAHGDQSVWGFQAEYMTEVLTLRSEYYHAEWDGEVDTEINTAYVEASYRAFQHWDVGGPLKNLEFVGRFNWVDLDADGITSPSRLTEHQEFALGVNYWIVPSYLVMKFSYHNVSGNLFAHDEELIEEGETPDSHTDLVTVGVDFSF